MYTNKGNPIKIGSCEQKQYFVLGSLLEMSKAPTDEQKLE